MGDMVEHPVESVVILLYFVVERRLSGRGWEVGCSRHILRISLCTSLQLQK